MPPRLAEIVIDAGLASREEVLRAAASAEQKSTPLVAALVRSLGLDELAVVAAIKRRVRVPIHDPAAARPDPDALRELSRDVCSRLRLVPLAVQVVSAESKLLRVAMADPTDAVALAEVEHITGCRIEVALMPLSAVEEMVETAYRSMVTEVMRRDRGVFGAGLAVKTEPLAPGDTAGVSPAADGSKGSATVPYHRVADEAGLELRHRALLELLVDKRLITRDEYEAQIRALMKQHSGDA